MTEKQLTPLEKARMVKAANLAKKKEEEELSIQESEPISDEVIESQLPTEPIAETQPETNSTNLQDKIESLEKMIPMIQECKTICEFILEHHSLNKHYQGYLDRKSEERERDTLYKVFEYYGLNRGDETNIQKLYNIVYSKEEHIDTICQYLAIKEIPYDRERFTFKEIVKDDSRPTIKQGTFVQGAWRP
jgi:hypothetical protein